MSTRYYTPFSIKRILRGTTDPINSFGSKAMTQVIDESGKVVGGMNGGFQHRLPDPTSRKDIEYYRDPAHRGYLSHTVEEGQGPSLFFKSPRVGRFVKRKTPGVKAAAGENRIW